MKIQVKWRTVEFLQMTVLERIGRRISLPCMDVNRLDSYVVKE